MTIDPLDVANGLEEYVRAAGDVGVNEGHRRGRVVDDLGRTWEYRRDGAWHCVVGEDDEHTWWVDVPYTWDEMVRDYGPMAAAQEVEG